MNYHTSCEIQMRRSKMTDIKEILRLISLGIPQKKIAESCKCSRDTVMRINKKAKSLQITWPLDTSISDDVLISKFYPKSSVASEFKMPDVKYVHKELMKNGVTLKLLWNEYYEECHQNDEIPFMYTQFCVHYRKYAATKKATMHINRKPGEIIEVDWAGKTCNIVDNTTGELIPIYIFVGVLPYSGYTYVEGFIDMGLSSWITAHVNMYAYFGGVSKILTPDNLKTGITKADYYEPDINKTYREMSEHYQTAIIPTRVVKPKDKPSVESSVNNVTMRIIAALRNSVFFSVEEINKSIKEKLKELNNKPFQKREGNRYSIFMEEEKPMLFSLPEYAYELAHWKIATVQFNYHVSIEKQNYSVPHDYISERVDIRISKKIVEIFYKNNRIASHMRLTGRHNQYSTQTEHMPPNHQSFVQWDAKRFEKWADKIGANTHEVIQIILKNKRVEQQAFKSCMGILKLSERYSEKALELTCKKVLSYTSNPTYKSIKTLIESKRFEEDSEPVESSSNTYSYTRGADYYGGKR